MFQEILNFFGRAICHQLVERTLQIDGRALSVCARDTGIYIGIFSSLLYLHLFKRDKRITIPSVKVSFLLLFFLLPMIWDGLGSYLHFFESTNIRRLVSGTSFGLVLPFFLFPLLVNRRIEQKCVPVIRRWWDFGVPLGFSIVLGWMVYGGMVPFVLANTLIILTIIVWMSLCASFIFGYVRNKLLRGALALVVGLVFLSSLSELNLYVLSKFI